ncbi:hypothetical protein M408DRAFT_317710 [Serendipita vermifera MAFF 305830]|uniref:Uncharacterized protein n=1 Tax=Serendipita vermifera MAFF 305830 TaxID=933852 RepID=A0A0C3AI03_SERVB|nr:hypothetical protein M408DRAFT_317710 [Serendipita vermifera MAFF 305830]
MAIGEGRAVGDTEVWQFETGDFGGVRCRYIPVIHHWDSPSNVVDDFDIVGKAENLLNQTTVDNDHDLAGASPCQAMPHIDGLEGLNVEPFAGGKLKGIAGDMKPWAMKNGDFCDLWNSYIQFLIKSGQGGERHGWDDEECSALLSPNRWMLESVANNEAHVVVTWPRGEKEGRGKRKGRGKGRGKI